MVGRIFTAGPPTSSVAVYMMSRDKLMAGVRAPSAKENAFLAEP